MTSDQRMNLRKIGEAAVALVVLSVLAGCGYHFKGVGLSAPEGVQTIAIIVLQNRTSESGIETVFTGDLAYEFTRSKVLRVVDKDTAEAILSGSIVSLGVDTIAHTASYDSDERRVTVTLDLVLKRPKGQVIWSGGGLTDQEEYKVSDKLTTESNKRAAIEVISKRLAEKIHNRILQDF